MEHRPIAVSGIKPTGRPHLGNLVGMIRPMLGLVGSHDVHAFIADGHALTTLRDPGAVRRHSLEAAAAWLAFGLDPERSTLYRQSDVPEVFELAWVLACVTPKGLLNRAHAYKAAVQENEAAGRPPDDGVNAGLFGYPVLMAADILLVGADVVPVGSDQNQHIEIARDIAEACNRTFGKVLTSPRAHHVDAPAVPGLDGRKMSKSYDNVIPIFADPDELRSLVMGIVTDPRPPEAPKDPEGDVLFELFRQVASDEDVARMRRRYRAGGFLYRDVKAELADRLDEALGPARRRYQELRSAPSSLEAVLREGGRRVRGFATERMRTIRSATGLL